MTECGTGDPPFLFVHGWAADSSVWEPQVTDLATSYRCVSVDLRGRGESPPAQPCDMATAADDLAAVIRELGLGPAIVAGHDIGGLAALILNHRYPDLVLGVVAGDSPIGESPPARAAQTLAEQINAAGTLIPAAGLIDGFFRPGTPPELESSLRRVLGDCSAEIAAGMLDRHEFSDSWDDLLKEADRKPFMAFWAERPLGDPTRLRELVVFVRQEPIPGAGHFFQLERAEVTNALLRAFVDDVRRDPRVAGGGT